MDLSEHERLSNFILLDTNEKKGTALLLLFNFSPSIGYTISLTTIVFLYGSENFKFTTIIVCCLTFYPIDI